MTSRMVITTTVALVLLRNRERNELFWELKVGILIRQSPGAVTL